MTGKDENKLTPEQARELYATLQSKKKKREDVITQIKSDFAKTDHVGVEITNTDLLQRFAKRARLCYHRGLICEVPPPATRGKIDIGDNQDLILREGRLYVIDEKRWKEASDTDKNH